MRVPRRLTLLIHYVFDQWIPPAIRDSRWFMSLFMNLSLGRESRLLRDFKPLAPAMTAQEMEAYYDKSAAVHIERETDLNEACIERICDEVEGDEVLDVACGRGFLANLLSRSHRVTGADFHIDDALRQRYPQVTWLKAEVGDLPFEDGQFDTVVCTHTLEHVIDPHAAIAQLRRVARRRLIVVVPRQRPYAYTFDLHLHFFPYQWQLELLFRPGLPEADVLCEDVGGDWYYCEVYPPGNVNQ